MPTNEPATRARPQRAFERKELLQRRVMGKRPSPIACAACGTPVAEGQGFTLICLGPGVDPVARERCQRNEPYAAASAIVHWPCATGDATPEATSCPLCDTPLTVEGACGNPECDLFPGPPDGKRELGDGGR